MDEITKNVIDMYTEYPYPSPTSKSKQTNELLNLLRLFSIENQYDIDNKSILDAGTGTGHRLIQAATFFKNSTFTAVDYSKKSLEIAESLSKKQNIQNVNFKVVNLMENVSHLGKFQIILCLGVLHHLSNPEKGVKNLNEILSDDGVFFLYLYGKLGGHQRMIRKKIISLLLGKNMNYEEGIKLVKELGFNNFEYGWDLNFESEDEEKSVIVDAFLHTNENLYDFGSIDKLMRQSGIFGYSIFGLSCGNSGLLCDTRIERRDGVKVPHTDISMVLKKSTTALDSYKLLDIKDRYRLIELLYEPNGYTIIGLTEKFYNSLNDNNRIKNNFICC